MKTKIIVSNKQALINQYGKNFKDIQEVIDELIKKDLTRELKTFLVFVDDADAMAALNTPPVEDAIDERQNKEAIDAICQYYQPEYLLLLGGPQIIPHQHLKNPVFIEKLLRPLIKAMYADFPVDNNFVPSDLPYACKNGYSKEIKSFLKPTRSVGRLAGICGNCNPESLTTAVKTAINTEPLPKEAFQKYFALRTKYPFQKIADKSLDSIFGNTDYLKTSPPVLDENIKDEDLDARIHFLVSHGSANFPFWLGKISFFEKLFSKKQKLNKMLETKTIENKIPVGAVVASLTCYAAQLYNPETTSETYLKGLEKKLKHLNIKAEDMRKESLCNSYLKNGAAAFCGGTGLTYDAGIITGYLKGILKGETSGEALLKSQLNYPKNSNATKGIKLKTLAQFVLLADPSVKVMTLKN